MTMASLLWQWQYLFYFGNDNVIFILAMTMSYLFFKLQYNIVFTLEKKMLSLFSQGHYCLYFGNSNVVFTLPILAKIMSSWLWHIQCRPYKGNYNVVFTLAMTMLYSIYFANANVVFTLIMWSVPRHWRRCAGVGPIWSHALSGSSPLSLSTMRNSSTLSASKRTRFIAHHFNKLLLVTLLNMASQRWMQLAIS